jgi:tetratricopeptide (TPR) repeat protein
MAWIYGRVFRVPYRGLRRREGRVKAVEFLLFLVCLLLPCSVRASPADPVPTPDLDRRLGGLESADAFTRRQAAESVVSIGPAGLAAISRTLGEMRKARVDPEVGAILRAQTEAGKALPKNSDELVDVLLLTTPSGSSFRTTLATACLVAALARIGTTEAVSEMILVVRDQGGAFAPEVARQLQNLGDRATAALILAAHDPARDIARWASGELEVLGKKVPGDAVQTKSNQVLSDVLDAYGATRDMDALSAVLSFVNSDRPQIRDAARHATLAYGDLALPPLRDAFTSLAGSPPPTAWSAAEVSRELFGEDDRFRLRDVYAMMDEGLADEARGKHEEAVMAFEKVLARQSSFDRRGEMVPAFVHYAQSKEDTDRRSAEAYYRIAERLAPDGPRASQAASALDYLEGEDLLARGIEDIHLFHRAGDEDPGNSKARDEVVRLDAERERREETIRRFAEGLGAVIVLVAGVVLWAGRRTRPAT